MKPTKINIFLIFGIGSALFLIVHSIFLGIKFDYDLYKFFRRFLILGFVLFEIIAQTLLVISIFYKMKEKIVKFTIKKVLILKIILVSVLIIVGIASLPFVASSGYIHFKHALEWNYFAGVALLSTKFLILEKKTNSSSHTRRRMNKSFGRC